MKFFSFLMMVLLSANLSFASSRLETDIVDTAVAAGSFQTLAAALTAAKLIDPLKGDGPFTVFAPSDDAFAKLPAGTVESLLKDIPALTKVLTYHVVAGELSEKDLLKKGMVKTLQGSDVHAALYRSSIFKKGKLHINNSKVLSVIPVKNGVIYVMDKVLLPAQL
jgi:uncharacterized surface protein with fasciclin (FAS1) repeats